MNCAQRPANDNVPCWARGLSRFQAAAYIGVGTTLFDAMVRRRAYAVAETDHTRARYGTGWRWISSFENWTVTVVQANWDLQSVRDKIQTARSTVSAIPVQMVRNGFTVRCRARKKF